MARCILSSSSTYFDSALTSIFYLGSSLNKSVRVLAINNFLAALRTKLCSEIEKRKKPKSNIMTFVIPPNLPKRSNQPKMIRLCFLMLGCSQKEQMNRA